MKKVIVFGVLLAILLAFGWVGTNSFAKTITLTYSSGYGSGFSLSRHDIWWAKELEKRTGGKAKIESYWSQALVKLPESLDAASAGIADITFFAGGYFGAKLPLSTAAALFYLTEKPDAVSRALMEIYNTFPPFHEEYEKNNVKVLTFSGTSPNIFGVRKPWKSLDDFKGKKIRTFPGLEPALKMLGAVPVAISWGEIYTSLERGVIDAYTGTMWDLAQIGKFHEQAPYIFDLGQGVWAMAVTVINKKVWNQLPEDIRKVIEEVTQEALKKQPELYMEADARAYGVYKKTGVRTLSFSPQEKARFRRAIVPKQWNDWVADMEKKGLPGKKFFELYKAATKKYDPQSTYVSPFVRYPDLVLK